MVIEFDDWQRFHCFWHCFVEYRCSWPVTSLTKDVINCGLSTYPNCPAASTGSMEVYFCSLSTFYVLHDCGHHSRCGVLLAPWVATNNPYGLYCTCIALQVGRQKVWNVNSLESVVSLTVKPTFGERCQSIHAVLTQQHFMVRMLIHLGRFVLPLVNNRRPRLGPE